MNTKAGGAKVRQTMIAKLGSPEAFSAHMRTLGSRGGSVKGTRGGFAAYIPCSCNIIAYDHHKAQCAGIKGGTKSRRTKHQKEVI